MDFSEYLSGNCKALAVVCLALVGWLAFNAEESRGQTTEQPITLSEALHLFGQQSLSLQLSRSSYNQVVAQARQVSAYPNPNLQLIHEPLFDNGQTISESYFNLSQQIEWPGLRRARIDAARQLVASADARFRADSLNLVFGLVQTFIETVSAEKQREYLQQVTDLFREADAATEAQFNAGELSEYRMRRLRVERARYENRLANTELQVQQLRRELSTLLQSENLERTFVPEYTLDFPPAPPHLDSLLSDARLNRPEYLEAVSYKEAVRFTLSEIEKSVIPAPLLTTGYKRQSNGFAGLFLSTQFSLPVFDRKQGTIAAQHAREHQAETRLLLIKQHIEVDVKQTFALYTSIYNRVSFISGELLSDADILLEAANISYAEGEMSLIELLDAAEAFYDAQVTSTNLLSQAIIAYYDMMRSTGYIPLN